MTWMAVLAAINVAAIGGRDAARANPPAAALLLDPHSSAELRLPPVTSGAAAAGKRVRATAPEYAGTSVYHTIFLPISWRPDWRRTGTRWPIIFEYTGNWFPKAGSTGAVKDAALGYGLSGGKYIWVVLPYIRTGGRANERTWWGDVDRTVAYAKTNVPRIIEQFGGNRKTVFLCGFSRGAIGVNFIGLHDNEIAKMWTAFITHDHFDGVKQWRGTDWGSPLAQYRQHAAERLRRVGKRPYLICQNGTGYGTDAFVRSVLPNADNFTYIDVSTKDIFGSFPNDLAVAAHNDRWLLKPSKYRTRVWKWMNDVVQRR